MIDGSDVGVKVEFKEGEKPSASYEIDKSRPTFGAQDSIPGRRGQTKGSCLPHKNNAKKNIAQEVTNSIEENASH